MVTPTASSGESIPLKPAEVKWTCNKEFVWSGEA
jgi:hypothetical protein